MDTPIFIALVLQFFKVQQNHSYTFDYKTDGKNPTAIYVKNSQKGRLPTSAVFF